MAVSWYLRFSLSYRDVEELLVERGLDTDHVTVWRWVQIYAPELEQRLRTHLRNPRAKVGVSMKLTFVLRENGPTFIGPWIRPEPRSTFCCRLNGTRRLPNDSFRKRYARLIIPLHASSMSINVPPTRRRRSR